MMKVCVIGGAGFLGINLVKRLLEEPNLQITVLDSLNPRFLSTREPLDTLPGNLDFIQGDMLEESLLEKVVKDQQIIFDLAAQSSHPLSVKEPLFDTSINCVAHLKLLEAVRKFNPESVIVYSSSSTVVGRAGEKPVDENHPVKPLEIYSANKAAAENYYRVYSKHYGLKTIVLRFANLYGPYGKPSPEFGFINYFIAQALQDKTLKVFGEGSQVRNLMYAGDAAECLWKAAQLETLYGEIFFATSPFYLSVREIAQKIIRVFKRGTIEDVAWPQDREKMEIGSVRFTSKKLGELLDWTASSDFEAGLKETERIMRALGLGSSA